MRRGLLTAALLLAAATPALAQHEGHGGASDETMAHEPMAHEPMDHEAMDHGAMDHAQMGHDRPAASAAEAGPPPRAFEGPEHAADLIWGEARMAPARQQVWRNNGEARFGTLMAERLEARIGEEEAYLWDVQAWYGGDLDRLMLKSEGEGSWNGELESAEVQALWSHAIGPFFDLQLGARYDAAPRDRTYAVAGVQGLAPYMFEVDAALFLSDSGDLTGRVEAEYDQRLTQRLVLQPRLEANLAAQNVPELGIGAGLSSVEAGLRLRYELAREFAPYIGVGYEARLGETADLARQEGEDPSGFVGLVGLRAWF
ncbi:hypothetical protein B5C34_13980 [Pacificimonas flava]|uniref:Copper resistance protein B n=3 Tax=Sphingosinicellaceae TaxID=2820280 RepID=A0A219B9K6_9SPHN|nr:copper resistance protein B [Pacificimonas flava]MBZ6379935.1 copper resistance protein B [Pacificimonas aurantium]OWV34458.1 hypothetical protein B5C34_13980 [Pacificimonas flava]